MERESRSKEAGIRKKEEKEEEQVGSGKKESCTLLLNVTIRRS